MEYSRTRRRCSRISRGAPMMTIRTKKSGYVGKNVHLLVTEAFIGEKACFGLGNSMSDVSISVLELAPDKDRLSQP